MPDIVIILLSASVGFTLGWIACAVMLGGRGSDEE